MECQLSDGCEQFLPFFAVDFMAEQVALNGAFLNGVHALPTDEDGIFGIVFEEVVWAQSSWRHAGGSNMAQVGERSAFLVWNVWKRKIADEEPHVRFRWFEEREPYVVAVELDMKFWR
jgi:hypothetical protein